MLCYVSNIVFIAYRYVAMINAQSLRGALGFAALRCCYFFGVNKSHRAVCDVCVFKPTVFGVKRNLVRFFV